VLDKNKNGKGQCVFFLAISYLNKMMDDNWIFLFLVVMIEYQLISYARFFALLFVQVIKEFCREENFHQSLNTHLFIFSSGRRKKTESVQKKEKKRERERKKNKHNP
jgi:hypothetical protein